MGNTGLTDKDKNRLTTIIDDIVTNLEADDRVAVMDELSFKTYFVPYFTGEITDTATRDNLRAKWIEYADGIRYSDFLTLVESRESFKKAFEDIMFSTKVVISDKDEFIDFVTKLSQEGFDEMALGYLDATSHLFGNDQDVLALYNVVRGNK